MNTSARLALLVALLVPTGARAQTIASRSESTPFPGVRLVSGRTASPATSFRALLVSLCNDYVHVTATRAPTAFQRTSTWASAAGVQAATNGDFFASGPRVYGFAIGGGTAWPVRQTGIDTAVAGEWYYRRYGWIGFGPGAVEFSHTERVKQNAARLGVTDGWMPATVTTAVPRGLTALVSGFPELVTEGTRVTCSDPTASSCFPDRSDMRARHPRTAMGLTRDRRTFLLVTVDGRSSASAGMYGTELARLMELLGAWQAFNLDGGGSTAMWVRGRGVVNTPSDASGERAVANHWGIFAGAASGRPRAPGSCRAIVSMDAGVADAGLRDAAVDVLRDVGVRDVGVDIATPRDVALDVATRDVSALDAPTRDVWGAADAPADEDAAVADDAAVMDDADVGDAGLWDDAGPAEELPEFADAARGEMPPPEAEDASGCSCRAGAPEGPRGSAAGLVGIGVVMVLTLRRRRVQEVSRRRGPGRGSPIPGRGRGSGGRRRQTG